MKTITINGITYPARQFDFNMMVELEDRGIAIEDLGKKPLVTLRAYVSTCIGRGDAFAGEQLGEHLQNGGSLEEIMKVMGEMIEDSGFFRTLTARAEEDITETPKKTRTKKTVAE